MDLRTAARRADPMTREALPDFLDDDNATVQNILTVAWFVNEVGDDVVLRLVAGMTGLGAGEDDVQRQVRALTAAMVNAQQWLDTPLEAVHDQLGRYEPASMAEHAGQFAAEHIEVARGVARELATALTVRAVA